MFTSFNTSNHSNKIKSLHECLTSIHDWMFTNKLKLNPDKIEFKLIGNKCHRNKFNSEFPVEILSNSIIPAAHAKNLGVYIDSDLNFQHHIKNTVKLCNYFMRDICRVRKHLNFFFFFYLNNILLRLDSSFTTIYNLLAREIFTKVDSIYTMKQ